MDGRRLRTYASRLLALLPPGFLFAMLASPTGAQVVRGRVVELPGNDPVEGALVFLVDSIGQRWGESLSNSTGGFLLRAPSSGSFLLRADRVGLGGREVEIAVLPEDTAFYRIELSAEPIRLAGITVAAARRCLLERDMGEAVFQVWSEARRALAAASYTYDKEVYRYRIKRFQRTLDERGVLARQEDSRTAEGIWVAPFESPSADELVNGGFVRADGESFTYFAPDADVLLSRLFLDGHCFRVRVGVAETGGLIGLAFEPVSDRRSPPDIKGILWLDTSNSELRKLEYEYVNLGGLGLRAMEGRAGGSMDFHSMPNGTWIIRAWRIRSPFIEEVSVQMRQLAPGGFQGIRVTGYWEEGGQVESVVDARGRPVLERERAILTGVVLDSLGLAAISGAHVRLSGVEATARTDAGGRFWFRDLSEGPHELTVTWPALEIAGHWSAPVGVMVRTGETASARPRMPPNSTFLPMVCETSGIPDDSGVLVLRIQGWREGTPERDDSVAVRWRDSEAGAMGTMEIRGAPDSQGRFVACGVPRGRTLHVEVVHDGSSVVATSFEFMDGIFFFKTLSIQAGLVG